MRGRVRAGVNNGGPGFEPGLPATIRPRTRRRFVPPVAKSGVGEVMGGGTILKMLEDRFLGTDDAEAKLPARVICGRSWWQIQAFRRSLRITPQPGEDAYGQGTIPIGALCKCLIGVIQVAAFETVYGRGRGKSQRHVHAHIKGSQPSAGRGTLGGRVPLWVPRLCECVSSRYARRFGRGQQRQHR